MIGGVQDDHSHTHVHYTILSLHNIIVSYSIFWRWLIRKLSVLLIYHSRKRKAYEKIDESSLVPSSKTSKEATASLGASFRPFDEGFSCR